jgi:hypothetical protein
MKKLTFCFLATSFVLFVVPSQIQAGTDENPAAATATSSIKSTESNITTNRMDEIKTIEYSAINSTENKETLKEASPVVNDQNRHSRRYLRRHGGSDVVVVSSGTQVRGDGYYEGRHRHSGAYIGGGGLLILIIILILVL